MTCLLRRISSINHLPFNIQNHVSDKSCLTLLNNKNLTFSNTAEGRRHDDFNFDKIQTYTFVLQMENLFKWFLLFNNVLKFRSCFSYIFYNNIFNFVLMAKPRLNRAKILLFFKFGMGFRTEQWQIKIRVLLFSKYGTDF